MKLKIGNEVIYEGALFRKLTPHQQREFRLWTRDNYKVGQPVNPVWHPVVRDECDKMNREAGLE